MWKSPSPIFLRCGTKHSNKCESPCLVDARHLFHVELRQLPASVCNSCAPLPHPISFPLFSPRTLVSLQVMKEGNICSSQLLNPSAVVFFITTIDHQTTTNLGSKSSRTRHDSVPQRLLSTTFRGNQTFIIYLPVSL